MGMSDPRTIHPGWSKARQYQAETAENLANGNLRYLMHGTGVGKTLETLLAMSLVGRWPVLVVTKAIGRHVWARDARWALEGINVATMWAGSKRSKDGRHRDGTYSGLGAALEDAQIIVINYEVLKKRYAELKKVRWAGLVFDEFHSVKGGYQPPKRYADNPSKIKWRTFEVALYLARDVRRGGGFIWGLTATPIRDRLRDLWAQLVILDPSTEWRWDWLMKYCAAHEGQYGWVTDGVDQSNMPELKRRLARFTSVIKREDVADQMPSIQRDIRTVTGKVSWKYLGGGIETAIDQAANQKIDVIVELALEYLGNGDKVVIATSRKRLAGKITEEVQRMANKNVPPRWRRDMFLQMVTGDTPIKARQRLLDDYQTHKGAACVIATADCMMESIDLHQSDGLVIAAIPYTPYALVQMEGRVARIGGKPCTIHYLIAENSIDVELRERLLSKLDTVQNAETDTQGSGGALAAFRGEVDGDSIIAGLRDWLSSL